MKSVEINGKEYELKDFQNRFYLYYKGEKIAELINGQEGLDRYYKGNFGKWVAFVKKRDMNRIDNIDYQIEKLEEERTHLNDRWIL